MYQRTLREKLAIPDVALAEAEELGKKIKAIHVEAERIRSEQRSLLTRTAAPSQAAPADISAVVKQMQGRCTETFGSPNLPPNLVQKRGGVKAAFAQTSALVQQLAHFEELSSPPCWRYPSAALLRN